MEYYDNEIREQISKLPEDDKLRLVESLFNAMTNSMRAFYLQAGHSDREIQMLIHTEVKSVKELIANRIKEMDIADGVDTHDRATSASKLPHTFEIKPTDDQFTNDTMIDLGLILKEFGVKSK